MSLWLVALLAVWVAGYVWAFRLMLAAARRAYVNKGSMLWQVPYRGEAELDGMGATFWALGVLFVPLAWPLLWAGGLVWAYIVRPGEK